MLPDGFEWRPFVEGQALHLCGRIVAQTAPASAGMWRVAINPDLASRRLQFFQDEPTAIAYVEAWVAVWEVKLREVYGRGLAKPG